MRATERLESPLNQAQQPANAGKVSPICRNSLNIKNCRCGYSEQG
jgi:hypothetical protein